jgi:hypothetical protein
VACEVAERTGRADVPFNHLGCVSGAVEGSRSISGPSILHRLASRRQSAALPSPCARTASMSSVFGPVDGRQPALRSRRLQTGGNSKILLDSVTRIS